MLSWMSLRRFYVMKCILIPFSRVSIEMEQTINGFDCFWLRNSSLTTYIGLFYRRKKSMQILCSLLCDIFPIKAIVTCQAFNIPRVIVVINGPVIPVLNPLKVLYHGFDMIYYRHGHYKNIFRIHWFQHLRNLQSLKVDGSAIHVHYLALLLQDVFHYMDPCQKGTYLHIQRGDG